MFCPNCGNEIIEGSRFCDNCGAPVHMTAGAEAAKAAGTAESAGQAAAGADPWRDAFQAAGASNPAGRRGTSARKSAAPAGGFTEDGRIEGSKVTDNIYYCPDGKYRWIYELKMLKNPAILITVWKVLLLSAGAVWLFMVVVDLVTDSMDGFDGFLKMTGMMLAICLVFLVLGVVAYLILAASYGWKYMVLFEMDESQITHMQMSKQFRKGQALGWLTVMAGIAAGNLTTVGAGALAASKSSSTSEFKNVEQIIPKRNMHLIKLNQKLNYNQVYAEDADYDFVWEFITARCAKARIRG